MSDLWSHYLANMNGHPASIVFDDGISGVIRDLPETTSILVTADLLEVNESNMPTDMEAERLTVLQAALDDLILAYGGYSVGRVTSNGVRHHFFYIEKMSKGISSEIWAEGRKLGYELAGGSRHDPDKNAYFEELYPDPESRQVVLDINVIDALVDAGDDIHAPRKIDHLSYFKDKASAKSYAAWASASGYEIGRIYSQGKFFKKRHCVETHNVTSATISAINPHSLGHFRKAKELGGTYDGWGCTIVLKSSLNP